MQHTIQLKSQEIIKELLRQTAQRIVYKSFELGIKSCPSDIYESTFQMSDGKKFVAQALVNEFLGAVWRVGISGVYHASSGLSHNVLDALDIRLAHLEDTGDTEEVGTQLASWKMIRYFAEYRPIFEWAGQLLDDTKRPAYWSSAHLNRLIDLLDEYMKIDIRYISLPEAVIGSDNTQGMSPYMIARRFYDVATFGAYNIHDVQTLQAQLISMRPFFGAIESGARIERIVVSDHSDLKTQGIYEIYMSNGVTAYINTDIWSNLHGLLKNTDYIEAMLEFEKTRFADRYDYRKNINAKTHICHDIARIFTFNDEYSYKAVNHKSLRSALASFYSKIHSMARRKAGCHYTPTNQLGNCFKFGDFEISWTIQDANSKSPRVYIYVDKSDVSSFIRNVLEKYNVQHEFINDTIAAWGKGYQGNNMRVKSDGVAYISFNCAQRCEFALGNYFPLLRKYSHNMQPVNCSVLLNVAHWDTINRYVNENGLHHALIKAFSESISNSMEKAQQSMQQAIIIASLANDIKQSLNCIELPFDGIALSYTTSKIIPETNICLNAEIIISLKSPGKDKVIAIKEIYVTEMNSDYRKSLYPGFDSGFDRSLLFKHNDILRLFKKQCLADGQKALKDFLAQEEAATEKLKQLFPAECMMMHLARSSDSNISPGL